MTFSTPVEKATNERLANWEYAAPEQRRPGQEVDPRADIFALGLILNEIFTAVVPHGADPVAIASKYPEYAYLDGIADAMRQNAPDRRPRSIAEIKNELISRGIDFVQQQKLDALRRTVIPTNKVSDPLVDDPIRLVDVDYRNGSLILAISQEPNPAWQQQFRNLPGYSAVMGSGPEQFGFTGKTATVRANENTAQMVIDHFKNYLQQTNGLYSLRLRENLMQNEERQRKELQDAIQRETRERETRERIKSKLTW
jgi:serine/threonine protein kinase